LGQSARRRRGSAGFPDCRLDGRESGRGDGGHRPARFPAGDQRWSGAICISSDTAPAGRNYDLLYELHRFGALLDRRWRIRPLGGEQRDKLDLPVKRLVAYAQEKRKVNDGGGGKRGVSKPA
jgi:hypothetical protein